MEQRPSAVAGHRCGTAALRCDRTPRRGRRGHRLLRTSTVSSAGSAVGGCGTPDLGHASPSAEGMLTTARFTLTGVVCVTESSGGPDGVGIPATGEPGPPSATPIWWLKFPTGNVISSGNVTDSSAAATGSPTKSKGAESALRTIRSM